MAGDYKTFTFEATGFKELEEVLVEMGEDLCYGKTARRVLVPAVKAALQPVAQEVRATIPYDEKNTTGKHMRETIRVTARTPSPKDMRSRYADPNSVCIGMVSIKTDDRGMSQEFGNARTPAQPFLRNALETKSNTVVNLLGTYLAFKLEQYKSKK